MCGICPWCLSVRRSEDRNPYLKNESPKKREDITKHPGGAGVKYTEQQLSGTEEDLDFDRAFSPHC